MQTPRISIIAAIGQNRELGKKNDLIWRISADLKRVKELTTNHTIIMGLNTYNSIGRPLPNRVNIVISDSIKEIEGCIVASSLDEAMELAKQNETGEIFIFGGARVYHDSISLVSRLYLTLIARTDNEADVFFPDYSNFTTTLASEDFPDAEIPFTWVTLEK